MLGTNPEHPVIPSIQQIEIKSRLALSPLCAIDYSQLRSTTGIADSCQQLNATSSQQYQHITSRKRWFVSVAAQQQYFFKHHLFYQKLGINTAKTQQVVLTMPPDNSHKYRTYLFYTEQVNARTNRTVTSKCAFLIESAIPK